MAGDVVVKVETWCPRCQREMPALAHRRICAERSAAEHRLNDYWRRLGSRSVCRRGHAHATKP